jgi:hypothetical protein
VLIKKRREAGKLFAHSVSRRDGDVGFHLFLRGLRILLLDGAEDAQVLGK